jgi:hypothetical protein
MATDRQIAVNRRNARKSTGPVSSAGRKRAARNAYRHGLSLDIRSISSFAKQVEKLARKIAADARQPISFERARTVAEAELELARVRQRKIAVIERLSAFEALDSASPHPGDGSAMSIEKLESAKALQQVLPELLKLDRYERRAASRRDRAVRELVASVNLPQL